MTAAQETTEREGREPSAGEITAAAVRARQPKADVLNPRSPNALEAYWACERDHRHTIRACAQLAAERPR